MDFGLTNAYSIYGGAEKTTLGYCKICEWKISTLSRDVVVSKIWLPLLYS